MITLAIEISNPSSGPRGQVYVTGDAAPVLAGPGVALGRAGPQGAWELLGAELLGEQQRHDDDLMPAIDRLCRRAGLAPRDLSRIAVSIGPGGYTSLRIAVATAKMLAEATGAATVAVPSAAVAAWSITSDPPALVCLASKGEDAWCALLPPPAGDPWWQAAGQLALRAMLSHHEREDLQSRAARHHGPLPMLPLGLLGAENVEALQPRFLIADRFLPHTMREAAGRVGAQVIEPVFAAEFVLRVAEGMEETDPLALAPYYPREAEAVAQWRRRAK